MTDKNYILKKASEYDVITFDVFDTLIIRDVQVPTDIFALSYGVFGRYIRVLSELIARKKSSNGEVTLNDIERCCPFSCKKELDIEMQYCRANPVMLEVYSELKALGKKIYAISDMYLSSEFLSALLGKCGFDIPVIVSCEEGCAKKSGELFKVFLIKCSLSYSSVLHIGDNKQADGDGAKIAGIESIIIEKHKNMLSYMSYSRKTPELSSFINHGLNEISDPVERIGYEIVGPIILAFCQWVHKKSIEYGFDILFFLARDMKFAYEMYKDLFDDNVKYLSVSRKSLNFAKEHIDEMCKYIEKEGCFANVSIVDTGWVGNAQIEIEKYSKMIDSTSDIGGLYLGTKLAFRKLKRSKRSEAFLYSTLFDQFKCQLYPPFMETLIGCNEKQVLSYVNGEPIYDREDDRDQTNSIKAGAKKFIVDWDTYKKNCQIQIRPVKIAFERLFYHPKKLHVELIGGLHYEDFKDTRIVSYDNNCNYFFHPSKFLADLSFSGWKGAFFEKTGILYPLVLLLYFWVGAFRLYLVDLKKLNRNEL